MTGTPHDSGKQNWLRWLAVGLMLMSAMLAMTCALVYRHVSRHYAIDIREDGVEVARKPMSRNEETTTDILRRVHRLQQRWHDLHGTYARSFDDLLILAPDDSDLRQLAQFAPLRLPYKGYVYSFTLEENGEFLDLKKRYFLVATPHEYGVSGRYSYALGSDGTVRRTDRQGEPVLNAGEVDETWVQP